MKSFQVVLMMCKQERVETSLAFSTRVSMHSESTHADDNSWSRSGSRIRWLRHKSAFKQRYHAGMLRKNKKFKKQSSLTKEIVRTFKDMNSCI